VTGPERAWTVAEVVRTLRTAVESSLGQVWIKGELRELKVYQSGHWYFTLRDADSAIRCVMWRSNAQRCRAQPADGTEIFMLARPDIWAEKGELRFTAVTLLPTAAVGEAQLALERTRAALARDGLFDPARKRPLPRFPSAVALVTSVDGAVLHDMVTVARRRWPVRLLVLGSAVQGEQAVPELVEALTRANRLPVDACVIARGGGSREDLGAFNSEAVCRAIAAVKVPTITAVGHQTDVTFADMVADVRAATPSAAMELLLPEREEILRRFSAAGERLGGGLRRRTRVAAERLYRTGDRLRLGVEHRLEGSRGDVVRLGAQLDALSPLRVLGRGYAVARGRDGTVLRRRSQLPAGTAFTLRVSDGDVPARVEGS
jgi:exodeoxyribonuclease VII large subunit